MGLAVRVIPTLLHRGSSLVKGKQFSADRVVGHALQAARIHAARGVDELCLLNIGATPAGQGPDFTMVRELCKDSFTPIAVGGGVRTLEDADALFDSGADKIVIGTNWELIPSLKQRYGAQAITASLDCFYWEGDIDVPIISFKGNTFVCSQDVLEFACDLAQAGAGELLLTAVDHEGMMDGYDLPMIKKVSKAVDVPVIAHGGCGTPHHMVEAIRAGASAVAAGSMFLFTDTTPADCARYLAEHGVETRVPA